MLSNQLSNWLSQISNDFDIGFNYRPGNEITDQEVEVALSTQLLNNKVTLNGNVDVGGNQYQHQCQRHSAGSSLLR
ncbi:MAG: translocation/assembly module TamB domain-containing protein [Marinilabiliales bacterium]|nr:translocation/assembly module TamB domain-containing protein [Marinilabiliales bacterium]